MHEVDFLPPWYPAIQRRQKAVVIQAWATLLIVVCVCGYALARKMQVNAAKQITVQTEAQINLSRQQLAQLSEKMKFEDQLREQDRIVARLGLGVETTRLLKALDDAMTPEMALTNLSIETTEQPPAMNISLLRTASSDAAVDQDRKLKVVVDGVAPTEIEAVTMMGNLLKVNCFENVAIQLNEGKLRDGHIAREFEVTFDMNLNAPAEVKQ